MKRLLLSVLFLLGTCATFAQGIPFIRSFSSDDYHGHPMNLDVITDDNGVVFVANFEGLLYYDNVRWHILHTPNLARVTVVYRDKQGDVWVGGYNYFGKVVRNPNGSLYLKSYGTSSMFLGEVVEIWEDDEDSGVRFLIKNGTLYTVKHDELSVSRKVGSGASDFNLTDVLDVKKLSKSAHVTALTDTIATETLGNGLMAVVRKGRGLTISDNKGNTFLNLNDTNGLKSNNIEYISYDGHGTLWAVLENEICAIAIPSAFSHVSRLEGLTAEVKTATAFNGRLYAGTLNGTYRLEGKKFIDIGIGHDACWQLLNTQKGLLAATAYGIFRIQSDGSFKQLTQKSSISVLETEEGTETTVADWSPNWITPPRSFRTGRVSSGCRMCLARYGAKARLRVDSDLIGRQNSRHRLCWYSWATLSRPSTVRPRHPSPILCSRGSTTRASPGSLIIRVRISTDGKMVIVSRISAISIPSRNCVSRPCIRRDRNCG